MQPRIACDKCLSPHNIWEFLRPNFYRHSHSSMTEIGSHSRELGIELQWLLSAVYELILTDWGLNLFWRLLTTFWYVISKNANNRVFKSEKKNVKYVFSNTDEGQQWNPKRRETHRPSRETSCTIWWTFSSARERAPAAEPGSVPARTWQRCLWSRAGRPSPAKRTPCPERQAKIDTCWNYTSATVSN